MTPAPSGLAGAVEGGDQGGVDGQLGAFQQREAVCDDFNRPNLGPLRCSGLLLLCKSWLLHVPGVPHGVFSRSSCPGDCWEVVAKLVDIATAPA